MVVDGATRCQHEVPHLVLAALRDALSKRSIDAAVVTRRRIVLWANTSGGPSGPTDPLLYVFLDGGMVVVTTNGTNYKLADGAASPVADRDGAAAMLESRSTAT